MENVEIAQHLKSAFSVLGYCKQFPNVAQLLQILGTLPITTAEAKRVFSKIEHTLTPVTLIAQPPNESLILQPRM